MNSTFVFVVHLFDLILQLLYFLVVTLGDLPNAQRLDACLLGRLDELRKEPVRNFPSGRVNTLGIVLFNLLLQLMLEDADWQRRLPVALLQILLDLLILLSKNGKPPFGFHLQFLVEVLELCLSI